VKHGRPYHPQAQGVVERVNRTLGSYITKARLAAADMEMDFSWASCLQDATYIYNTTFHSAIGTTPFHVFFGRKPPKHPLLEARQVLEEVEVTEECESVDVESILRKRQLIDEKVQIERKKAAKRMMKKGAQEISDLDALVGCVVVVRERAGPVSAFTRIMNTYTAEVISREGENLIVRIFCFYIVYIH